MLADDESSNHFQFAVMKEAEGDAMNVWFRVDPNIVTWLRFFTRLEVNGT